MLLALFLPLALAVAGGKDEMLCLRCALRQLHMSVSPVEMTSTEGSMPASVTAMACSCERGRTTTMAGGASAGCAGER